MCSCFKKGLNITILDIESHLLIIYINEHVRRNIFQDEKLTLILMYGENC
jgi:hypothetical protein